MLIYAPVDGDGFVRRLDSTPPDPADKQKELLLGSAPLLPPFPPHPQSSNLRTPPRRRAH